MQNAGTDKLNYENALAKLRQAGRNRVAVLVDIFRTWHKDASPGDAENTGGRMGGIYKLADGDIRMVLDAIWEARGQKAGSHLDYITRIVAAKRRAPKKERSYDQPGIFNSEEQIKERFYIDDEGLVVDRHQGTKRAQSEINPLILRVIKGNDETFSQCKT
jgi:hypothetical protein